MTALGNAFAMGGATLKAVVIDNGYALEMIGEHAGAAQTRDAAPDHYGMVAAHRFILPL